MIECTIGTQKYDIDLERLLHRRLQQCGCCGALFPAPGGVRVAVARAERERLAEALALLLCRDLRYFELARMADALPLTLAEKQQVLTDALENAHAGERLPAVREGLRDYLEPDCALSLEGYLTFRMQDTLEDWRQVVERAAAEQILCREYSELMGVLNAFVEMQQPRITELSVCINPDGSCTLTDDSDARIEYVDCSEDGIVSLLVGMAPEKLTVYDLSGGAGRRLADAIQRVFAGRVRVYR